MDKLLKNVNNVDEYIIITQGLNDKYKNTKAQLNITTVLALKKLRSLEIEYLNKCYENGAACILFERLLSTPPSKTWGVLAKELVTLLQYWLEAIRKYLINHNDHWWSFLKLILKFIKEIRPKNSTIPNILVELTAECLFDIASRDNPDAQQRYEILHCLNVFCAESSREIRFALRIKFNDYFTKLASHLARSGHLPSQYSTLEALVRWLVPRQEPALRAAAAARWFPADLCPEAARVIFINATWMDFFQDAREFLNTLNDANGLVTSVVCRKLTVGHNVIVSGAEKQQIWLDINSSGKSISVLLDPRVLEQFGVMDSRACETMMIADDDTQIAQLTSESQELTISLDTYHPPRVHPADIAVGGANDVRIVISTRVDVKRLDAALRGVFGDKYHILMDLDAELSLSPMGTQNITNTLQKNNSEEDTRFSHPVEARRWKHSGIIVRSKNAGGLVSPSTASTSSLARLGERLSALPELRRYKEPVSVCAKPQVASVTEISQADDRSFRSKSTLKYSASGVCYKNSNPHTRSHANPIKKKAESDSETLKVKPKISRRVSPVVSDENSASCLLVATIGSADDSVINDTIERMSKSREFKNENIVDLLVNQAIHANTTTKNKQSSSGINSGDKKKQQNSQAIENTPTLDPNRNVSKRIRDPRKKISTVISKSTTEDESNPAVIETPALPHPRNGKKGRRISVSKATNPKEAEKPSFDVQAVEQFFLQHFAETEAGEVVISPTLAKKINETSSETSETFFIEDFDKKYLLRNEGFNTHVEQIEFIDVDVIDCLNEMVDKICINLEKCTEYLNISDMVPKNKKDATVIDENKNMLKKNLGTNVQIQQTKSTSKKNYNLRKKTTAKTRNNNIEQNSTKKMSTIIEQRDEEIFENVQPINSPVINEKQIMEKNDETPVVKRKRKLYSPKDYETEKVKKGIQLPVSGDEDDIALSKLETCNRKITKTTATSYKDIEKERQKSIRLPCSKKSTVCLTTRRGKVEDPRPSPRTLRMNAVFDDLRENIDNKDSVVLVDKNNPQSIYNYNTSDEDENFTSTMITKRGKQRTRVKNSKKSSNDDTKKTKPIKKKAIKKTNHKSKVNRDAVMELDDERMRKRGSEELNTSIFVEKTNQKKATQIDLELNEPPAMEPILDDEEITVPVKKKADKKIKKLSLKIEKASRNEEPKFVAAEEDNSTSSPLPGLEVEPTPLSKSRDSVPVEILEKILQNATTQNMRQSDVENVYLNISGGISIKYNKNNEDTDTKRKSPEKNKSNIIADNISALKKNDDKMNIERNSFTKDMSTEVIASSEAPHNESANSIATDAIRAHGDVDEEPPSPEMIRKRIQPREIEDLNESEKDFFMKLNRVTYDSNSKDSLESSYSKKDAQPSKVMQPEFKRSPCVNSPMVSINRLSFDDIGKWIPSGRSTDTDSSIKCSSIIVDTSRYGKVHTEAKTNFKYVKKLEERNVPQQRMKTKPKEKKTGQIERITVDSPKENSPVAPIAAISFKERNQSDKSTRQKPNIIKDVKSPHELTKRNLKKPKSKPESTQRAGKINPIENIPEQESDFTGNAVKLSSRIKPRSQATIRKKVAKTLQNTSDSGSDDNAESNSVKKRLPPKNYTIISPVKSFENGVTNTRIDDSDDEHMPPKVDQNSSLRITTPENQSSDSPLTKEKREPRQDSIEIARLHSNKTKERESAEQIDVPSTKLDEIFKTPMKRMSFHKHSKAKKRRVDASFESVNVKSALSVSSVNDWFKRTESSPSANDTNLHLRDEMENIMEKLDMVVESNKNTGNEIAKLFLEALQNVTESQKNRQETYITVMEELIRIIKEKIADTEKRLRKNEKDSLESLKKKISDIVHKEFKQKRSMVVILKEDVQTVIDHLKRNRTSLR